MVSLQGKVTEIYKNQVKVLFSDGVKMSVDTANSITLERELTEEEINGIKKGDELLVKLRHSKAMARGMTVS